MADTLQFLRECSFAGAQFYIDALPGTAAATTERSHQVQPSELIEWHADPVAFIAKLHSGSKAEYLGWMEDGRYIHCCGRTRAGKACKLPAFSYEPVPLREWAAGQGKSYCKFHGGE